MTRMKWDQWAPVSGVVFVGLIVATFFLPTASPPDTNDSAQTVVSWFTDHRTALLTSGYLSGLAIVAFAVFLGSLIHSMRAAGEDLFSWVTLGGGVLLGAYAIFSTATQTLLAFNLAKELDAATVKGLWELGFAGFGLTFPLAILAVATSLAALRTRFLPQWYGMLGILASLWFVVGGATYARTGFFSPDGAYGFIGLIAFLAWVLLTSILVVQHEITEEKAHRAAPLPA